MCFDCNLLCLYCYAVFYLFSLRQAFVFTHTCVLSVFCNVMICPNHICSCVSFVLCSVFSCAVFFYIRYLVFHAWVCNVVNVVL